jgi:hypothetical protein
MLLALGAASSVLDALKSLTSSKSSSPQPTGVSQDSTNPFNFSGSPSASGSSTPASGRGASSPISPETMSALLAAQSQSGSDVSSLSMRSGSLKDWFAKVDSDADGKISKSEFEALGAGGSNAGQADGALSKLDTDGDGSISPAELLAAMRGKGHHRHQQQANGSRDPTESDPLLQASQGASSTSVTNSDGSTTTSLTYADGSKVTMTSAAAASSTATSSYNFIEQMIAREAKAISTSAAASLSVSA